MLSEGFPDVNEFSSATGTYEALSMTALPGGSLRRPPRGRRLHGSTGDELLDGRQVIQHRLVSSVRVAAPDRAQDPPVVLMGALGPAAREQAFFPALPQEVDERVDDADNGPIMRGGGDGGVERGVLCHTCASARDLSCLFGEDAVHLGDLLAAGAPRREGGDGGLEEEARLEELSHRLAVRQDDEREGLDQGLDRDIPDEGALARPDVDEPAALQRAQRLAHRGPADAEPLGQLPLRRETVARGETAIGDQGLDLADDFLVDPDGLDRLELHHACPGSRPWRAATLASHHPSQSTKTPSTIDSQRSAAWAAGPSHRWTRGSSVIISPAT